MGKSEAMFLRAHPAVQALRVLWLSAPFWMGCALSAGLHGPSAPIRVLAVTGLWAGWAVTLAALLVPSTVSLTIARALGAAVTIGATWVSVAAHRTGPEITAIAAALVATGLLYSARVGETFVQGSAYGDETRFPLRPPAAALAAPVAWAIAVIGLCAGPGLLAARQWAAGAALLVIGIPLAWAAVRGLHGLSRRFVVLVPAGLVLHDHMTLADTALFRKTSITAISLAPRTTTALDLTGGSPGLAVELALREDQQLTIARGRGSAQPASTRLVLFAPSRPGRLLAECSRRRLPVGDR